MPFRYASPSYRVGVLGGEFDRANLLAGESYELVSGIKSIREIVVELVVEAEELSLRSRACEAFKLRPFTIPQRQTRWVASTGTG